MLEKDVFELGVHPVQVNQVALLGLVGGIEVLLGQLQELDIAEPLVLLQVRCCTLHTFLGVFNKQLRDQFLGVFVLYKLCELKILFDDVAVDLYRVFFLVAEGHLALQKPNY